MSKKDEWRVVEKDCREGEPQVSRHLTLVVITRVTFRSLTNSPSHTYNENISNV